MGPCMSAGPPATADWLPVTEPAQSPHASEQSANQLPDIRVNGRELRDTSTDGLQAVVAANDPARLFSRAGSVVRVDQAEDGRPIIVGVTDVHLRGEMTRAANFHKLTKRPEG